MLASYFFLCGQKAAARATPRAPVTTNFSSSLTGAIWTGQGLGYIEGSAMTDQSIWAIIGPILAGLGVGKASSSMTGYWRVGVSGFDHKSPEATS